MKLLLHTLKKQKKFILKSDGYSMFPLLYPGDIIYCTCTTFQKSQVGDIILAQKGSRGFCHRVIFRTSTYLITKGDNCRESDGKIFPHQVIARIYQIKRNNTLFDPCNMYLVQSSFYFSEIVKMKNAFERQKLNFAILKGLPLHLYFEKIHPRRLYADCDILIDPQDDHKVKQLFQKLGYAYTDTSYSRIHALLKDKPTEISFHKHVHNFSITFDIHFEPVFLMNQLGRLEALYPQRLIDEMTEEFLKNKREIKIQNNTFSILFPEYLILYLALHFFHHNYRGIFRLELIDKIIRIQEKSLDWEKLKTKVLHYKIQNFVYPVFLLLQKYYATPLPKEFIKSLKLEGDKGEYIRKNILRKNIFDDETRMEAGINRFKNLFYLSPGPLYQKGLIFITPSVIYSVVWTLWKRFISGLRLSFLRLNPSKVH